MWFYAHGCLSKKWKYTVANAFQAQTMLQLYSISPSKKQAVKLEICDKQKTINSKEKELTKSSI